MSDFRSFENFGSPFSIIIYINRKCFIDFMSPFCNRNLDAIPNFKNQLNIY